MRKLFNFYLRESVKVLVILTVISLLIAYAVSREGYIWYNDYRKVYTPQNSPFNTISIIAGVLATIVPIVEFSYKMRKITIDQVYSFPIKREKLFITKYLIGLIEVLVPVTITTIYFFLDIISTEHLFDLVYFVPYYFSMVGTTIIIYSITTFMFTRANTVVDGVINVIFGVFFLPAIFGIFEVIDGDLRNPSGFSLDVGWSFYYSPLVEVTTWFTELMEYQATVKAFPDIMLFEIKSNEIFCFVLQCILAVVSIVLSIILIKKDKSEDSMGISNSWFSYRTMIPYFLSTLSFMYVKSDMLVYIFLIIGGYMFYVAYRRTLKIKWYDIICIFAPIIIGYILRLPFEYNLFIPEPYMNSLFINEVIL